MLATTSQTAYNWTGTIAEATVIIAFFAGILFWIGRQFWKKVDAKISAVDKKATPNGGHTLDLGDTAARTEGKVDELRGMFLMHLQNHPGPGTPATAELPASLPRRDEIARSGPAAHTGPAAQ